MSELGPDARSLLHAVRGGDDPSLDDEARVRAMVGARIAAAAGVGAATALGAKSAAASAGAGGAAGAATGGAGAALGAGASASGVTLATKLLVALAITSGTAGITVAAVRAGDAPQAIDANANANTNTNANANANTAAPVLATGAPVLATAAPVLATAALAPVKVAAPVRAVPQGRLLASASSVAPASAVAPAPIDTLTDEAALLRSAHAALSRGDTATANSRLDDHASRFPNGALAEERSAARVHTLCAQGRAAEARTAAGAFVAAHPRSSLAPAVRRACAERE